jgi:hypothetical protein
MAAFSFADQITDEHVAFVGLAIVQDRKSAVDAFEAVLIVAEFSEGWSRALVQW